MEKKGYKNKQKSPYVKKQISIFISGSILTPGKKKILKK